jgi:hypothetical protein
MANLLLARDLQVEADYGQIYIYDPQTQVVEGMDELDDDQWQLASEDAYDSRRFVGYDKSLVSVITPSQFNWKVPLRLEVSDAPPALDAVDWDHIVEVPLPTPSGTLCFQASGGGEPIETTIPPGTYRARFSGRGYTAEVGEIEGHETYRLQLWPAEESESALLKYWDGFDLLRPNA